MDQNQIATKLEVLSAKLERKQLEQDLSIRVISDQITELELNKRLLETQIRNVLIQQELERRPLQDEIKELMVQQAEITAYNNEFEMNLQASSDVSVLIQE